MCVGVHNCLRACMFVYMRVSVNVCVFVSACRCFCVSFINCILKDREDTENPAHFATTQSWVVACYALVLWCGAVMWCCGVVL